MEETLEQRLAAVERAITDGEHEFRELGDTDEVVDRLDEVESNLDALSDRVAELEAASQALRGYVGNLRSVNRDVERRADAALAAVESTDPERSPANRPDESSLTEGTTPASSSADRASTAQMNDSDRCSEAARCPFCGGTDGTAGVDSTGKTRQSSRSPAKETSLSGGNADAAGREAHEAVRAAIGDSPGPDESDSTDKHGDKDGLLAELRQRL